MDFFKESGVENLNVFFTDFRLQAFKNRQTPDSTRLLSPDTISLIEYKSKGLK